MSPDEALALIESREYYEAKPHKAVRDLEAVREALEAAKAKPAAPAGWVGLALSPGDAASLLTAIEFSELFLTSEELRRIRSIASSLRAEINEKT